MKIEMVTIPPAVVQHSNEIILCFVALVLVVWFLRSWFKDPPTLKVLQSPPEVVPKLASPGETEKDKFYTAAEIADIVRRVRSPGGPPSTIECFDPSTFQKLGVVPAMKAADVKKQIALAREAQAAWCKTTFGQRRQVLRMLMQHILEHQDYICRVSSRDSGKTLLDAELGEIFTTLEKLRHLINSGEEYLKTEVRPAGLLAIKSCRVEYYPSGVIGIIAPWNYPFHNIYGQVASAIFAGCGAVVKVSEWTSWSGSYLISFMQNALKAAGHDPNLVQVVTGYGDAGAAVITEGADKIIFTGSPNVGKRVMETASKTLTPVVLELGGKDPIIICEDADLDAAIQVTVRGVFTNSGQNCINIERAYVADAVYDRFVEGAKKYVKSIRQGPPLLGTYDIGPMTMPGQAEYIDELVKDAVLKGAKALVGGQVSTGPYGQFYEPTMLVNVDHSMRIVHEEVFGPVMVVIRTRSDAEAVQLANGTPYGLGSTIYSKNYNRADALSKQLQAGMTVINDYGVNYLCQSLPFGGMKISGFGRFNGPEGIRFCCHQKSVVTDKFSFLRTKLPRPLLYPVPEGASNLVAHAVQILYSNSISMRLKAIANLLHTIFTLKY
mmetsp:Transcript_45776/g.74683  ORF Transcript_45776/g.74683 Transcript_45776/m.74683 type:complete len:608 (-) Transcript_45776:419-2242(-)